MNALTHPTPKAAVITSDAQALAVAEDLAQQLQRDSAQRDRERLLPYAELELFTRSGLWGISVPKAFGGAGVSNVTLAKVVARIAQADAALGQIPQNHFYALEVLRVNGTPEQQQRLYAEVLAGRRFGNALAELGTKTAHDRTTRLSRDGDGLRINGRKFYATGALYAQRIPTSVVDDAGVQQLVFVPADSPGLQVIDDWSGFGQRTTGSGSVVFDNVPVRDEDVVPFQSAFDRPTPVGPWRRSSMPPSTPASPALPSRTLCTSCAPAVGHGSTRGSTRPVTTRSHSKASVIWPSACTLPRPCWSGPGNSSTGPATTAAPTMSPPPPLPWQKPGRSAPGLPRRRHHPVRTGRQPGHPGRAQPRPALAQRPSAHPARPGALEVPRHRQLLPQWGKPAASGTI